MSEEYTNYTIRLQTSKRDEWKDVVEESDQYSSISQLIRHSVDQQVGRLEDVEEDGMTKEEKDIIDQMKSENSRIRDLIQDVKDGLDQLEQTQLTTAEAEALTHNQTQTLIQEFNSEGVDNE